MNNKGFTLVELLAVLVVLTTILLIAIPTITSSVERNKEKIRNKKIDIIESAGYIYADKYKNIIPYYDTFKTGNCCIDINDVLGKGLLTNDDIIDADKNPISGYICCSNKDVLIDEDNTVNKFVCSYKETVEQVCEELNNE